MQEKETVMAVRFELRFPSLGIIVRQHSASLMMPNSYPRDGIFNLNLTTIKDLHNVDSSPQDRSRVINERIKV